VMLSCEVCGGFFQQATGRPARTCPEHRPRKSRRYGNRHQRTRAATLSAAYGAACTRCGLPMLPGQALDLDHADDGSGRYLGYAHSGCNRSVGASLGNRMRGLRVDMSAMQHEPAAAPPVCKFHGVSCGSPPHSRAW
jgi:hypothetical protein